MTKRFFLSRAGADQEISSAIGELIEAAGHEVVLQQWDFKNASFMNKMHEALHSCDHVIALLSPGYMASDHCKAEWQAALAPDPLNNTGRLIVLRVANSAPRGLLAALAYWDLLPVRDTPDMLRDIVLAAIAPDGARKANGALSQYWRAARALLHPRLDGPVPNFTGRREDLEAIAHALWQDGGAAALTQKAAVRGMGGVGKSVLARQYGWATRDHYAGVWWFDAATNDGMIDGMIALGAVYMPELALIEDRHAAAARARDFLSTAGFARPWLLIYDNVEAPDALGGHTPRSGAHLLITTRFPQWQGIAKELAVDVFAPEVAVAFLQSRANREGQDAAGALQLAEALGYLPLALDHAGAYCRLSGIAFDSYRRLLSDAITRAPTGTDTPQSVHATFTLALARVIEGDAAAGIAPCPDAQTLMGLFAFFAPDGIPLDLIGDDIMSPLVRGDAVAALAAVSLIKVVTLDDGSGAINVHRLVQRVMRARLGDGVDEAMRQALTLLAAAFPSGNDHPADVRHWPRCAALQPHAEVLLAQVPDQGESADKAALLLSQLGQYLHARADYAAAEPLMRRALKVDEASLGPDHHKVAIRLNNLAQLLMATNRLDEAEPLMRRALEIDKASFGPAHSNVARDLNNLAIFLGAKNRLDEAEPLMRRVLGIDEASFGPDHPNVARNLNNLAQLLQDTNRLDEAEPLMRRALKIDKASFGPDHPNVARDLNNLAQLLQDTNRLDEAEPLMRRALKIVEASYGPDHPDVARYLNNMAGLLDATNRLAEAESLYRRALKTDETIFGPDHPDVALDLNNLAALLKATDRLDEAEPLAARAVTIVEASLPEGHPSIATVRENLALIRRARTGGKSKGLIARLFGKA